jgi:RNA polymerase sigma factor (sigma-70 family)
MEADVRDHAGWAAVYDAHYLGLVRLAVNLVDDLHSAEDVVQDVFAAAQRAALPDDPGAYLRTAVVNRARSVLRRRQVARAFGVRSTVVDLADAADEDVLRTERRTRLLAAIAALPARQKEVVVLRYYEDLRVAEIATVLGISPAAVSTSLARALDALKEVER